MLIKQERRPRILLSISWYSNAIYQGIASYAAKARWILDINRLRSHWAAFAPLGNWQGDGVICSAVPEDEQALLGVKIPAVSIGYHPASVLPSVCDDNEAIGKMAGDYFAQRGFKHYAFYRKFNTATERVRMDAYARYVTSHGKRFHCIDAYEAFTGVEKLAEIDIFPWLIEQIRNLPKPVAVFSEFDDIALDVINACFLGEIPIPEEVAVLGVDNDDLRCEFGPTPLSSIDNNQKQLGYEAAALLDRLMQGHPRPRTPLTFPPRGVVTRKSTSLLAVEHPMVALALRLIWEHYTEPINVAQIADAVPMSYRRLHDAFIQHIGHSMADELLHKRLEHAQRLLTETEKPLQEIAVLAGFQTTDYMGRAFQRKLHLTPSAYRKQEL